MVHSVKQNYLVGNALMFQLYLRGYGFLRKVKMAGALLALCKMYKIFIKCCTKGRIIFKANKICTKLLTNALIYVIIKKTLIESLEKVLFYK